MKESMKLFVIGLGSAFYYVYVIIVAALIALSIRASIIQAYKLPTGGMEPTLRGSAASIHHPRTIGDHLFVKKFKIKPINRGEIVVFKYPFNTRKDYVKRIVGMPGDIIQIKNKKVYINQKRLDEPWLKYGEKHFTTKYLESGEDSPRDNLGPIIIPKKNDIIRLMNDKIYINDKFIINKKIISIYSREVTGEYFKLYEKSITPSSEKKYIAKYDCYFVMGDNRDNSSDSRYWGFLPEIYINGKPIYIYHPSDRRGKIE